jgi:hypothetical protein
MSYNTDPHKRRQEIETELLAFELTERRAALAGQLVLLAVTVAFAVVAIVCALRGYHWPALATGGSSGLAAAASARRRER